MTNIRNVVCSEDFDCLGAGLGAVGAPIIVLPVRAKDDVVSTIRKAFEGSFRGSTRSARPTEASRQGKLV